MALAFLPYPKALVMPCVSAQTAGPCPLGMPSRSEGKPHCPAIRKVFSPRSPQPCPLLLLVSVRDQRICSHCPHECTSPQSPDHLSSHHDIPCLFSVLIPFRNLEPATEGQGALEAGGASLLERNVAFVRVAVGHLRTMGARNRFKCA